ncbi:MAG TPA: AMIN domain-containing protein [Terriglobales bacterium]|nr:AMIN domain-containing protein [Terriglobales bacterium]
MSFCFRRVQLRCAAMLMVAPLAAQAPPRVQHISVLGSGQAIEVEIQSSGPVTPQCQAISNPDRIIVDFPGALPAAELRPVNVSRGPLKAIRSGLFSANPPVTRVVLDLAGPQQYQIFSIRNAVMLKVGTVNPIVKAPAPETAAEANEPPPVTPQKPPMDVTYSSGMLRIHVERATLAQVLYEVQRQTGAEIAIPAGAESEEIAAELGPAPVRDVLAALLNGSRYNFIFVGNNRGRSLQKAILTVR